MKLRVYVRILSDGKPLIDSVALDKALNEARRIFMQEANTTILPTDNRDSISVIRAPAPEEALNVGCDSRALRENLSVAGSFFRAHSQVTTAGVLTGYGSPITVFIVANIEGKLGCSLGPLADYVTVEVGGLRGSEPWTLAHELGHACNLPHAGAADTLMRPGQVGRRGYLKPWQKSLFRASRHVTYL